MPVKPVPDGYSSIIPYLTISDAASAIEYYKDAFGATERLRMPGPGGKIGHAEIEIGGSVVMLSDEYPDMGVRSPKTLGGTGEGIMVYLPDVDGVVARMEKGGGTVERTPADQFYGDRTATVVDPFGHRWFVSTHVEDVSHEELQRRSEKMQAS
jgi:PhnB protein